MTALLKTLALKVGIWLMTKIMRRQEKTMTEQEREEVNKAHRKNVRGRIKDRRRGWEDIADAQGD